VGVEITATGIMEVELQRKCRSEDRDLGYTQRYYVSNKDSRSKIQKENTRLNHRYWRTK
jgi:hypothetical protein